MPWLLVVTIAFQWHHQKLWTDVFQTVSRETCLDFAQQFTQRIERIVCRNPVTGEELRLR